jgi:restriction system protein
VTTSPALSRLEALACFTLEALNDLGGSGTVREIDGKVAEKAGLTNEQLAIVHGAGPQTELAHRAAWVRTRLKQLEAIENVARGVWAPTERGRSIEEADRHGAPAGIGDVG